MTANTGTMSAVAALPGCASRRRRQQRELGAAIVADLRTDHAGETGAVWIYRGVLTCSPDADVRSFATRHLATEKAHLMQIESWLPRPARSRLLPLWRAAGFLTGALPALAGRRAVYATIEAVETFVDGHYAEQIERLRAAGDQPELLQALSDCRDDEVAHRDEAAAARGPIARGPLTRLWCRFVDGGSRAAVAVSRRI